MPAIVPAIVAAVGAIGAAGSIGAVTFFGLQGSFAVFAIAGTSMALSSLASSLSPKPKAQAVSSFSTQATNRTLQIRQPITARRVGYGEVRMGGVLIYAASTENNKYLHLVLVLAAHEVESIDEIWVNDDIVANDHVDGSGNVTQGKYAGVMRIKKHLGGADQEADSDLVSEIPEWTTAHRGRGHAYIYVRMQGNRDVFKTGSPNFSAVVRGKKIYDIRDGAVSPVPPLKWTPNAGLMSYDWLTDSTYGIEVPESRIQEEMAVSSINACDEIVSTQSISVIVDAINSSTDILTLDGDVLKFQRGDRVQCSSTGTLPTGLDIETDYYVIPFQFSEVPRIKLAASLDDAVASVAIDISSSGSGVHTITKTGEPRYYAGGILDTSFSLADNFLDVLSGMGGNVVCIGGEWSIFAAVYRAPDLSFNEDDLRAPIEVQTRLPQRERFNAVKGVYSSPVNSWQPADYPSVVGSVYVSADGGRTSMQDIDLPFTQRAHTAQRLAKIALERNRREISSSYPAKLGAIQLQPADTVYIDNDRMAWASKIFEVTSHRLIIDSSGGTPLLGVDMGLRETDSAVYNWSSSEEGGVAPALRSRFPNPFSVTVPVGVSLDSIPVATQAGDRTFKIKVSWDLHEDSFVRNNGRVEIQFRESFASVWRDFPPVDGAAMVTELFQAEQDLLYDVRVRAVNALGVPSSWVSIEGFSVGSSLIAETEDWESDSDASEDWESDTASSEDYE